MSCIFLDLPDEILDYIFNYLTLKFLYELKKCNKLLDSKINNYIEYLSQQNLNEQIFFNQQKYRYYDDILYLNYFLLPFDNNQKFPIHKYFCQNKHFLLTLLN